MVCEKVFRQSGHLKRHKLTHTKKTFNCMLCERAFSLSSTLQTHKRLHTGEKPFKCVFCEKA